MERVRPAAGALAVLLTAGLLSACGSSDNPISGNPGNSDRPLTSTGSPSPSAAASVAPSASADPSSSAAPTVGSPIGGTIDGTPPTGVLVQGTGFTVRLPGEPEKSSASAKGGITFDIYRYESDTAVYTVTRGNYPRIGTLPTLRDAITSAAGQAGGKLTEQKEIKYRHEPGIEGVLTGVKLDGKDVTVFVRYVVVNRVMYGLLYLDKNASPAMTAEFTTFVASLTF